MYKYSWFLWMSMYFELLNRRYVYLNILFWLRKSIFQGDYTQQYGNVRNSTAQCQPTNYSSWCQNQCLAPAQCSSSTGRCQCPLNYKLIDYPLNNTLQTCQCPGYPIEYYNGSTCVNITGKKLFLIIIWYRFIHPRSNVAFT